MTLSERIAASGGIIIVGACFLGMFTVGEPFWQTTASYIALSGLATLVVAGLVWVWRDAK